MKALRYALLGFFLIVAAFGQTSKLREVGKAYAQSAFQRDFSSEIVILPKVYADSDKESRAEKVNRDLEKIFATRKKHSFSVSEADGDSSSLRHSLEESPIVEFAMMGAQDIKKLKGGFTIKNPFGGPDIDAYLKRGIAWHPSYDKNLTYTLGKRVSRSYRFNDGGDIFDSHIKAPIERFNARIERVVEKLVDGLGL